MVACSAKTAKGIQCKNDAKDSSGLCSIHMRGVVPLEKRSNLTEKQSAALKMTKENRKAYSDLKKMSEELGKLNINNEGEDDPTADYYGGYMEEDMEYYGGYGEDDFDEDDFPNVLYA